MQDKAHSSVCHSAPAVREKNPVEFDELRGEQPSLCKLWPAKGHPAHIILDPSLGSG